MILQVMFYFDHCPGDIIPILGKLTKLNASLMLIAPVAGILIIRVSSIGWDLFKIWAGVTIVNNILVFLGPPLHHTAWPALASILILSAAAVLWKKEYITLFFTPRLHWWKPCPRYQANYKVILKDKGARIRSRVYDISRTGAFISDDPDLHTNTEYIMGIFFNNIAVVRGRCQIVRRGTGSLERAGIGVQFSELESSSKQLLKSQLTELATYV